MPFPYLTPYGYPEMIQSESRYSSRPVSGYGPAPMYQHQQSQMLHVAPTPGSAERYIHRQPAMTQSWSGFPGAHVRERYREEVHQTRQPYYPPPVPELAWRNQMAVLGERNQSLEPAHYSERDTRHSTLNPASRFRRAVMAPGGVRGSAMSDQELRHRHLELLGGLPIGPEREDDRSWPRDHAQENRTPTSSRPGYEMQSGRGGGRSSTTRSLGPSSYAANLRPTTRNPMGNAPRQITVRRYRCRPEDGPNGCHEIDPAPTRQNAGGRGIMKDEEDLLWRRTGTRGGASGQGYGNSVVTPSRDSGRAGGGRRVRFEEDLQSGIGNHPQYFMSGALPAGPRDSAGDDRSSRFRMRS